MTYNLKYRHDVKEETHVGNKKMISKKENFEMIFPVRLALLKKHFVKPACLVHIMKNTKLLNGILIYLIPLSTNT